jgi:hypothetical protein
MQSAIMRLITFDNFTVRKCGLLSVLDARPQSAAVAAAELPCCWRFVQIVSDPQMRYGSINSMCGRPQTQLDRTTQIVTLPLETGVRFHGTLAGYDRVGWLML